MRSQRHDVTIILFCAIPLAIGVALWLNYNSGGPPPFGLPAFSLPSVTFPKQQDFERYLPTNLVQLVHQGQQNSVAIVLLFAFGGLCLVMLSGIYVDVVHRRKQAVDVSQMDDEGTDNEAYDAPWLHREDVRTGR